MGYSPLGHDALSFLYIIEFDLLKFCLEFYISVREGYQFVLVLTVLVWFCYQSNVGLVE